jgi:type II secretory pathway pseudopilin PulG
MSLLEVILAIAILAGTLAVLGEIVRSGSRSAQQARELAEAQFFASSIMAEITAGIVLPESTEGQQVDDNGQNWNYSILVEPTSQEGLLAILVTAHKEPTSADQQPVTGSLARWMVDPQLEDELQTAADQAEAEAEPADSSSAGSADQDASPSGGGSAGPPAPSGGGGGR